MNLTDFDLSEVTVEYAYLVNFVRGAVVMAEYNTFILFTTLILVNMARAIGNIGEFGHHTWRDMNFLLIVKTSGKLKKSSIFTVVGVKLIVCLGLV